MKLFYTALLIGFTSVLNAQTQVGIVAYSTDTTVYPLDNDSTVFNPGVADTSVQRILDEHHVWYYKRLFWRNRDTMAHQLIILCKSDVFKLADTLKSTGKFYELYVDSVSLKVSNFSVPKTNIFPNPSSSNLNMEFALTPVSINLYDMKGKLIFRDEKLLSQTEYRLNTSMFNSGLYSLQVVHENGSIESHRIVIVD